MVTSRAYSGSNVPTSLPTPLPTPVPTMDMDSSTTGVAYAGYHTIHIVDDDGGLWYAGYGAAGRLGSGSTGNVLDLTRMAGVNNVKKFDQRQSAGIALTGDGKVW